MILFIYVSMYFQVEGGEGMKQLKAVVLEKKGSMVTILASDGSFQKVRYRKPVEIGAEIEITDLRQRQPLWRTLASVAAVFLFVLLGSMSWNLYQGTTAVAMISVDINPRLQLTLDQKGRVLQSEALNSDAEHVLTGLELKGEPWNLALENIIEQAVTLHYLNQGHNWVLVGYSPVKAGQEIPKGVTPDDIAQKIESAAQAEGMTPKVAVYQLGAQEQTQAKEQGLTLGEYALMNTAQDVGIQAKASTVENTDERVNLLEQPQVQKQMVKENQLKGISDNRGTTGEGNDQGNNSNQNAGDNPDNQPAVQPGNNVAKPSRSSQEEPKQDSNQGKKEQGKIDEKETGVQAKQGGQVNQGEQEKLKKSKSEENNPGSQPDIFEKLRDFFQRKDNLHS